MLQEINKEYRFFPSIHTHKHTIKIASKYRKEKEEKRREEKKSIISC